MRTALGIIGLITIAYCIGLGIAALWKGIQVWYNGRLLVDFKGLQEILKRKTP